MMKDGATLLMGCFMVIVVIMVIALLLISGVGSFMDNRTTQLRAQEELERARTDREHQQSIDWEHSFMTYAITLKSFANDSMIPLVVISGIAGALVAGLVITLAEMYWRN